MIAIKTNLASIVPWNIDERKVYAHLLSRHFTDIKHEPEESLPPDFLVNGKIAIEVRRLNQNHFTESGVEGLEEAAISLSKNIFGLLRELGAPIKGESWIIKYEFSRPVEKWKTLKPKIEKGLQGFIASSEHSRRVIVQIVGFKLEVLCKTVKPRKFMFVPSIMLDEQSGGFIFENMEKNIQHCVREKSVKIEKAKGKYPECEWWLGLVDYIGFFLDAEELEMFRRKVCIDHNWDKILIINQQDPTQGFEI